MTAKWLSALKTRLEPYLGLPDRWLFNLAGLVPRRNSISAEDYLDALRFYLQDANASRLLTLPDSAVAFNISDEQPLAGGQRLHHTYQSRYEPRHPLVAQAFEKYPANSTGHFFLWRHDEKKQDRPLVLCLHGFLLGDVQLAEKMFRIPELFAKGVDVGLFVLPHHGERTSHWINQRIVNPDNLPLTVETFAQAMHDLRSVHLAVNELGYQRVGLIGASLGGYCGALYASLVDNFDFLFTVVPALDLHEGLKPLKKYLGFEPSAEVATLTAAVLDLITPGKLKPRLSPEKIAVVYHDADQLNLPKYTESWIATWAIPTVFAVPGGHWLHFQRKTRGRAWYSWLAKHGYIPSAGDRPAP